MRWISFSTKKSSKYTDTFYLRSAPQGNGRDPPGSTPPSLPENTDRYSLEQFLHQRIRTLALLAEDVRAQIQERRTLSQQLLRSLDEQDAQTSDQLDTLRVWPLNLNDNIDNRRRSLEQQLDTLRHERRQEQVSAWTDTAQLHRELRDRLLEYFHLQNRIQLLGGNDESATKIKNTRRGAQPDEAARIRYG